jgi:hypothetical protein
MAFNNADAQAEIEFDIRPSGLENGSVLFDRLGVAKSVLSSGGSLRMVLPKRSASMFVMQMKY